MEEKIQKKVKHPVLSFTYEWKKLLLISFTFKTIFTMRCAKTIFLNFSQLIDDGLKIIGALLERLVLN